MSREKKLILAGVIGLFVIILLAIILVAFLVTRQPLSNQNGNNIEQPPVSYYNPPTSNPVKELSGNDNLETYVNSNLPGLTIQYPSSWELLVKEFKDSDGKGFQSKYFPICDNNCMGLKFTKNNVDLSIIFDLALDDSGKKCSNTVTYEQIDNNWLRIKDRIGYFYTKNYQFNVTTKPEEPFNLGNAGDEWSLLNNTNYKICVNGTGYFRDQSVNVNNSPSEPGTLVENPIIHGNPSQTILREIDGIIKTLD